MFGEKDTKKTKSAAKICVPSIISSDLEIDGNLKSTGDIQIDGRVNGDVTSNTLTISAQAVVRGTLQATDVVIAGEVIGSIQAKNVKLMKSAHITADICHESLAIEAGAHFEGHCRQINEGKYALDATPKQVSLPPKRLVKKADAKTVESEVIS